MQQGLAATIYRNNQMPMSESVLTLHLKALLLWDMLHADVWTVALTVRNNRCSSTVII